MLCTFSVLSVLIVCMYESVYFVVYCKVVFE